MILGDLVPETSQFHWKKKVHLICPCEKALRCIKFLREHLVFFFFLIFGGACVPLQIILREILPKHRVSQRSRSLISGVGLDVKVCF